MKKILLILISFGLTLLLVDFYIKKAGISPTGMTSFYEDIGRGRRADYQYVMFNEGFTIGQMNQYRYLGKAYPEEKENGVFRIAVLGDSFIEAFQVLERDRFSEIMESKLNSMGNDKQIQVLNFGRSGFDLADMYSQSQVLVDKFHPDITLYFISTNDLEASYSDNLRPNVHLINDSLQLSFDYPEGELKRYEKYGFLLRNSALFYMSNQARRKVRYENIGPVIFGKFYTQPSRPAMEDSVSGNYELHSLTKAIINGMDPKKVILVNRGFEPLPEEFMAQVRQNRLPYLDLSIVFDEMVQSGVNPGYWNVTKQTGHWNYETHQVIAEELTEYINERYLEK